MPFASKQPSGAVAKMTLEPMMTLESHEDTVRSMHYFPDGKRMISGSYDKTTRQWDMQSGREIEKAREVCGWDVRAVALSRDGRWVITAGGDYTRGELKACEMETGIVKTFQGHSGEVNSIDICNESTLFASGSEDYTTRIWSLDTGKLVAGPFKSADWVGAVRFSRDSKKLAVNSFVGKCLEVWNVQTQKLHKRVGQYAHAIQDQTFASVLWTNKDTILAVFGFITEDSAATIYEFDASTLETVGAPFKGHTDVVRGLALSFDGALVASASYDCTIRLWAFESRQVLASFHVLNPDILIFSPNTHILTYTTRSDSNIYICSIPPNVLAGIEPATEEQSTPKRETNATPQHLLDSDATRHPRAQRHSPALSPVVSCAPTQQRPLPTTRDPPQHAFICHLRKFLRFSFLTDAAPPVLNGQSRDPLDFPAPSPLHPTHSPSQAASQGRSYTDRHKNSRRTPASPTNMSPSTTPISFRTRLSTWWPVHPVLPNVNVPLAQGLSRVAVAGAPKNDDDLVPAEYFDIPSLNPDSQQPNTATPTNSGEHGNSRLCFCV
ncbi:WD40 repeat-like protein [Rhizopogon salebrosus TDB-379]|nr:WD40 repeat-like protein [Rhizopogon salebrosus TDB-379]